MQEQSPHFNYDFDRSKIILEICAMKWFVAGTSYHNVLTSAIQDGKSWKKLQHEDNDILQGWELHQLYIWKLHWLLMIATQLNEGTFNIYLRSSGTEELINSKILFDIIMRGSKCTLHSFFLILDFSHWVFLERFLTRQHHVHIMK